MWKADRESIGLVVRQYRVETTEVRSSGHDWDWVGGCAAHTYSTREGKQIVLRPAL